MKLTKKIHLLRHDFDIHLGPEKKLSRYVNSIIIFGTHGITLIDTGVKGNEKNLFEYIQQNNRDYSEITTIILSHSHPDHIGSASKIKELTGCEVLAHELEREWIEDISLQKKQRPVPGFYELVDQSVAIDAFIKNKQLLQADSNITLEFIHAPGHSKGSLNILFKEDNILFTADSIPLKGDIPNYDNYTELVQSLSGIKKTADKITTVLTSWTPPLFNKKKVLDIIDEGEKYMKCIDSAVKLYYKKDTEPEPMIFCKSVIDHLKLPPFYANPIADMAFRSHSL